MEPARSGSTSTSAPSARGTCILPQPIQDFDPPGATPPLITDEQLNFSQDFNEAVPIPVTAACCDPDNEQFTPAGMYETAFNDCAARSCLEVHDQFALLAAVTEAQFNATPNGITKNALERAFKSLDFYVQVLEDPQGFADCTNGLGGVSNAYNFPDSPDPGLGALQNLRLSDFECPLGEAPEQGKCAPVDEGEPTGGTPTTGGGGGGDPSTCEQNPNYFEGNAADSIFGLSVPEVGEVLLSGGGSPDFQGTQLSYRRHVCEDDVPCLFVLTDLTFDLGDVVLGPLKLVAPHVVLDRAAMGLQVGDDIKIAAGELTLRVESTIFFAGKPIFGDAVMPLWVHNRGTSRLILNDEMVAIDGVVFDLALGAQATVTVDPAPCIEW